MFGSEQVAVHAIHAQPAEVTALYWWAVQRHKTQNANATQIIIRQAKVSKYIVCLIL